MIRAVSIFWYIVIGVIFSQETFADTQTQRLILDHLFVYKNQVVDYRISVRGEVPITWETKGVVLVWFPTSSVHDLVPKEKQRPMQVAAAIGTGRVSIRGRGSLDSGGKFKIQKINYDSSMMVTVNGIERYIKAQKIIDGSHFVVNLEL